MDKVNNSLEPRDTLTKSSSLPIRRMEERPRPQTRIRLPEEDPFSLKVVEQLERQGLTIRWRYGFKLANRYEVRRIHAGGMGIVWIVEDLFDNRKPYAAKSVKPFFRKPVTDEEWEKRGKSIQRFLEECKIWVDLEKHRHIVNAEFLEKIEDVPLVMSEYIEGGDLTKWIEKGPWPIETVLNFAIQFCIGMEYANKRGVIIHRDIKPGNIMITPDRVLKINDFGLSRAIGAAEEIRRDDSLYGDSPLNIEMVSISRGFGTPPYMAPEQFDERLLEYVGHPVYPIGPACDVFASGLVFYEMLKGEHAYKTDTGSDRDILDKAFRIASKLSMNATYVYYFLKSIDLNLSAPISNNEQLDNFILKCLRRDPNERYESFTELKGEFIRIYHQLTGKHYEVLEEPAPKPNYKNKAKTAFILGREEKAIKLYDMALEENPGDTGTWLEKGLAMAEVGKLKDFGTCSEIIKYFKPSKEYSVELLFAGDISERDIRLIKNISSQEKFLKATNCILQNLHASKKGKEFFKGIYSLTPLLSSLKSDYPKNRCEAIVAIGQLGDRSAVPYLIELLRDNNNVVLGTVARILGILGDMSTIPYLIKLLKHKDGFVSGHAADALCKLGDKSITTHLVNTLQNHRENETRASAARALGELCDKTDRTLLPHLLMALRKDTSEAVRLYAAQALAKLGDKSGFFYLVEKIMDRIPFTRKLAIFLLAELGNTRAIPYLIKGLKDKNKDVRVVAGEALAKLANRAAIPYLKDALKDESNKEKVEKGFLESKEIRFIFTDILNDLDRNTGTRQIIPLLLKELEGKDENIRRNAIRALCDYHDESIVPCITKKLRDIDVVMRRFAVSILSNIRNKSSIPYLLEILNDEDEDVRSHAARALAKLGDKTAIPYLVKILKTSDFPIDRISALEALGSLNDRTILIYLIKALEDGDGNVRFSAFNLLTNIGYNAGISKLIKCFDSLILYAIYTVHTREKMRSFMKSFDDNLTFRKVLIESLSTGSHIDIKLRILRNIYSKPDEEVLSILKQTLKPYSAFEWNRKGLKHLEAGKKKGAIKCFKKAIEIDPDWQEPRDNLEKTQQKVE